MPSSLIPGTSKKLLPYQLSHNLRNCGGDAYLSWLELVLDDPKLALQKDTSAWKSKFIFTFHSTPQAMIEALKDHVTTEKARAFLASSYTESDGRDEANKIRLKFPEIKWCMQDEYLSFWRSGNSNNFTMSASPYGCGGLQRDYIGVIWRNDLAYRNGKWVLHENETITDDVGGKYKLCELVKK